MDRRQLLLNGARLTAAVPFLPLLAACDSDDGNGGGTTATTGTTARASVVISEALRLGVAPGSTPRPVRGRKAGSVDPECGQTRRACRALWGEWRARAAGGCQGLRGACCTGGPTQKGRPSGRPFSLGL